MLPCVALCPEQFQKVTHSSAQTMYGTVVQTYVQWLRPNTGTSTKCAFDTTAPGWLLRPWVATTSESTADKGRPGLVVTIFS